MPSAKKESAERVGIWIRVSTEDQVRGESPGTGLSGFSRNEGTFHITRDLKNALEATTRTAGDPVRAPVNVLRQRFDNLDRETVWD